MAVISVPDTLRTRALEAVHPYEIKKLLRLSSSDRADSVYSWSLLKLVEVALSSENCVPAVQATLTRRTKELLSQVAPYINALLEGMRKHGAVLSGSRCLAFFDHDCGFNPDNWDWYVAEYGYKLFLSLLIQKLGYELVGTSSGPQAYSSSIEPPASLAEKITSCVVHHSLRRTHDMGLVHRTCLHGELGQELDVICSRVSSPLLPISLFHSTIVQNFVSYDGFCMACPELFFSNTGIKASRRLTAGDIQLLEKYRNRGYNIVDNIPTHLQPLCLKDGYCSQAVWRFGNQFSLVMLLKFQGLSGRLPDFAKYPFM
ncbi:hypothetical protein PsYK624_084660 [Phanerochaete sordida]|uniref:Uncharacterized protein n=1 Tax=Phanerochaete sordida TaxID=48140 RepID=A0A9P3GCV4_9APHY|nr:hypothetical protein PsYK624_084660 [Phanerochaete sordida]